MTITQLRAIRLSATVIAFVSSIARFLLDGVLSRGRYQYFQPYVQIKYCESLFLPDSVRLLPFAIGAILFYV